MLDSLSKFFKPIPSWDMDRAKQYIATHKLDDYNLIDVRQPDEFAEGHLPGATLIPLADLPARLDEVDRSKPTLVYCRSGNRAGNATALLGRAGFERAHNIGGVMQWNGLVATGAPEAGMAIFDAARRPEEYVALAWSLEEEARLFYVELGQLFPELKELLEQLAAGEERHRELLARLHRDLTGSAGAPSTAGAEGVMEGGVDREEAVAWAREREPVDALELAVSMEANAHDRYIHVGRAVGGKTERAFLELAEAEKIHLTRLMEAFQQHLR